MHTDFENFMTNYASNDGSWEGGDDFGYSFTYREFDRDDLIDFHAMYGYEEAPELGWYFGTWDSQGFRTWKRMPNEERAEDAYIAAMNDYLAWCLEMILDK